LIGWIGAPPELTQSALAQSSLIVILAKAGIHGGTAPLMDKWLPAFAG
jgi:hypothetical protein